MIYKGRKGQLRRDLGFRMAKEGEKDILGDPIGTNYVVPVKIKDCRIYEKDGYQYYDASEAPMLDGLTGHSRTNMVYGRMRKRKSKYGKWIEGELVYEYYSTPIFFVYDARVYSSASHQKVTPQATFRFLEQEKCIQEKRMLILEEKLELQIQCGLITEEERVEMLKHYKDLG